MNQGESILVVGDEPESLRLLTSLLAKEGYKVRPADSAESALDTLRTQLPDLILLDICMPGLDGLEVCQRVKVEEWSRLVPVIIVAAAREIEQRAEGLKLGAVDIITKPLRGAELVARVRTIMELGRLRANLEGRVTERTAELRRINEKLKLELIEGRRSERALRDLFACLRTQLELGRLRADLEHQVMEGAPEPIEADDPLRPDLAEDRRNDQVLGENGENFWQIADCVPAIIWTRAPGKETKLFNKQAAIFTGRTISDLRRHGWQMSVHAEDRDRYHRAVVHAFQTQEYFQLEYRLRRADGKYRWVLSTGVPRFIRGSYIGHVGTILDVTDLRRSQQHIFAAQKLETIGALAAGIAHNFNNMLGAIFAETDLAVTELPPDSAARDNLERITKIAIRASEIVKLLMAYASGRDPAMQTVHVPPLVAEVLRSLKVSISKTTTLRTDFCPTLPPILANPLQIQQVILNLITNAYEALEGHQGSIAVTANSIRIGPESTVKNLGNLAFGEYVALGVSDTGCGMTEEVQMRAFDPFYTTKFLGRGLGLAVVQGIIRSHHGDIHFSSVPGKGSSFEILLPCVRKQADNMAGTAEDAAEREKKTHFANA